jgi:hypothetical protein
LTKGTFDRWLNAVNLLESAREEAWTRCSRTREPICKDEHNNALQAVHVEALNCSGLSAKASVEAQHISV